MTHGMIVAPQPEAVEAGAEALRRGANAVDAAITCALVQGVVDPMMTGIGGFGSLQLYLPGRGVHTFMDFHGRAPAAARPDMCRFSSMCPSIVFRDGVPHVVIGAPGGTQIAMGVLQVLLNTLDFDMPIVEAVAAPRFSATSDWIDVANRIPASVTRELEAMGYPIARSYLSYAFAGVHAIRVDGGRWSGGADPSHDGMALEV
jgi:gamma-glutamyltranspeptidase